MYHDDYDERNFHHVHVRFEHILGKCSWPLLLFFLLEMPYFLSLHLLKLLSYTKQILAIIVA